MKLIAPLIAALLIAGCHAGTTNNQTEQSSGAPVAPILTTPDAKDTHSFANPVEARVSHVALDLNVDFDTKRIGGVATLDIQRKPDAKQIILLKQKCHLPRIAKDHERHIRTRTELRVFQHASPLLVTEAQ